MWQQKWNVCAHAGLYVFVHAKRKYMYAHTQHTHTQGKKEVCETNVAKC